MKKREKPKITTIIFDMGGVLYFYDHMKAARKMSNLLGVSAKKIVKEIGGSGQTDGFTRFCENGASEKEYWDYFRRKLGLEKINPKKMQDLWNKIFSPNKKIFKILPKLKKQYKLGLISNMGVGHKKFMKKRHNITKPFNKAIFSCDVGVRKPNLKIFKITLKKLKTTPQEAIFIDDLPRNVKAAKKLGLQGIVFKTDKQLFKQLEKLGVKV